MQNNCTLLVFDYNFRKKEKNMPKVKINDALPNFKVTTSKHDDVQLKDLVSKNTIFWIIRYIGCTVCRYDVHLLANSYHKIKDKGYDLFVVMQSDKAHIINELKDADIPFEIICDNQMEIYKTLEINPALDKDDMVKDKDALAAKVAKARALGFKHGDYEGDELQLPALLITDKNLKLTYVHYGNDITDMPSVEKLINEIL